MFTRSPYTIVHSTCLVPSGCGNQTAPSCLKLEVRGRQRDRDRDRETQRDRQTDTETDTETDRLGTLISSDQSPNHNTLFGFYYFLRSPPLQIQLQEEGLQRMNFGRWKRSVHSSAVTHRSPKLNTLQMPWGRWLNSLWYL